ncbi:MAG: hypothetical protein ACKOHK_00530, partial [Planctomycetia bacterium]
MSDQEPSREDLPRAIAAECERLVMPLPPDAAHDTATGLGAYAARRWAWYERRYHSRHTGGEALVSRVGAG